MSPVAPTALESLGSKVLISVAYRYYAPAVMVSSELYSLIFSWCSSPSEFHGAVCAERAGCRASWCFFIAAAPRWINYAEMHKRVLAGLVAKLCPIPVDVARIVADFLSLAVAEPE